MKKPALLLLVGLTATATLAWSHGPTRKKVEINESVAATPEAVWAVIGNFQEMGWHPAVTKTEGQGGNEPGATRTLTLVGGGQIAEKRRDNSANHVYNYRIEQVDPKVLPVTD